MKVVITEDVIEVYGSPPHEGRPVIDWSCRLSTHEACAWAIKRLGEELEKSVQFYYTGEPTDNIVDASGPEDL